MPTIQDLPKIQNMAIRLSALEVSIYREAMLNNELKTQQQITNVARQELAAGKQPDAALVKEMQAKTEQQVQVLKRQMEEQLRHEQVRQHQKGLER